MSQSPPKGQTLIRHHWILRHSLTVRITHWTNALCLAVLLMSGLQIFNATPALYWGKQSDFRNPIVSMNAVEEGGTQKGVTTVFGRQFDTTGYLGLAPGPHSENVARGFPSWITLPGEQNLAVGRRWHFFFAWLLVFNGLIYLVSGLVTGHFRIDLFPSKKQLRHIGRSILDHMLLRFPKGEAARRYNVLQKLSYLIVVFILIPVMVLAGLTMSPAMDTAVPQLLWLFGGRQAARTVHFVVAWALVLFFVVHVAMVILAGFWNEIRSMITGRYSIEETRHEHAPPPVA